MNRLQTDSEKNQHRGLKEMLLGINYSVRNVTAHKLKIKWAQLNINITKKNCSKL
jgi:hypothetical protein